MLSEDQALALFRETEAILSGHFLLSSGLHSDTYLQCARVLQFPIVADTLCTELAKAFLSQNLIPEVVMAPALGGVLVAYAVAEAMARARNDRKLRNLFAEREAGVLRLRRGFEIRPGERVLVVEDVITTGLSTRETIEVARAHSGQVIGVGSLVDRGAKSDPFDVPQQSLLRLNLRNYTPEQCPQCRLGAPVVKPGSRAPKVG